MSINVICFDYFIEVHTSKAMVAFLLKLHLAFLKIRVVY